MNSNLNAPLHINKDFWGQQIRSDQIVEYGESVSRPHTCLQEGLDCRHTESKSESGTQKGEPPSKVLRLPLQLTRLLKKLLEGHLPHKDEAARGTD